MKDRVTAAETANRGKRLYDPVETRRRILDTAAGAFQARGYHATGMHEIMRDGRVTGGALYHHFPTKKALGLAVIRERVAPAVEETWIVPVRSAATAQAGILAVFEQIAADLERRGAVMGCPLNNLAHELSLADSDFRAAMDAIFTAWRDAIAERLRSEPVAAGSGDRDADALATFVVASYSGAMALAKTGQDAGRLRASARQLARLLPGPD
jgi:AcrR family transcriptional regulator